MLNGGAGGISPINCNKALINSSNVTIEWQLDENFIGLAGAEYTLIQADNVIDINNCNFVDSTGGGDFTLSLSGDGKRLYLTQGENYPRVGTWLYVH